VNRTTKLSIVSEKSARQPTVRTKPSFDPRQNAWPMTGGEQIKIAPTPHRGINASAIRRAACDNRPAKAARCHPAADRQDRRQSFPDAALLLQRLVAGS
jgi:hypothetical protein